MPLAAALGEHDRLVCDHPVHRRYQTWGGVAAEIVHYPAVAPFTFAFDGSTHYLTLCEAGRRIDGVDDADDRCPYESEDVDGVDDGDGCPDPDEDIDGDKDGIYGSLDRCPKEKENENGYLDDDGCPDQLPPKVAELTGSVDGIVFASGSDRLERSSYAPCSPW